VSAGVDVIGCYIAQSFVVTPVIVVFDKGTDCFLELTGHIIRQLVNLSLYGAMISFYLTVSLRMKWRGSNMSYPHESQVLVELVLDVASTVI
jgi:hypothetical protein